jgi:transforming growth factor-beta-induced protein
LVGDTDVAYIIFQIVLSNALENGMMVATRSNGTQIGFAITPDSVRIAHAASPKATVTRKDIMATNGIVHLIDRVLIPPTMTITDMVVGMPDLSTLLDAVQAAGLAEALAAPGPLTVFAPTNEGAEFTLNATGLTRAELLASENLAKYLQYHVTTGVVLSSNLTATTDIATLGDMTLPFVLNGDSDDLSILTPGNIVTPDIIATNGKPPLALVSPPHFRNSPYEITAVSLSFISCPSRVSI